MNLHRDVTLERWALEKERRTFIEEATKNFDKEYYKKLDQLYKKCEKIGHLFTFTHFGPLGNPWYVCNCCGKSKCESADDEDK